MDAPAGDPEGEPAGSSAPAAEEALLEAAERAILGGGPRHTRAEVSRASGVDLDQLTTLWRALGFASPAQEDDALFLDSDVEAIRGLHSLLGTGVVDEETAASVVRTIGRTYARLTEWQVAQLQPLLGEHPTEEQLVGTVSGLLPLMRDLQEYVWRRHLASATARALAGPGAGGAQNATAVGFADIVGFTRNSRKLSGPELADLVERFEATANELVAGAGGRIIKTIGDEVMYAADSPEDAVRIALNLLGCHRDDDTFPEIRAGVAFGPVLSRLGDIFGETVNIAARLTSLARPGTVLVNRAASEALEQLDDLRVRRVPPAQVKGYSRLESWVVRPATS